MILNDGDLQGWMFVKDAEDGGIQNGELVLGSRKSTVIIAVDGVVARDYEITVSVKIRKLVSGACCQWSRSLRCAHHARK